MSWESDDDEDEENLPAAKSVTAISRPTPYLPPVLNLHGPPVIRNDPEPSPKKKRRKKKKKKYHVGGEAGTALQTPTG